MSLARYTLTKAICKTNTVSSTGDASEHASAVTADTGCTLHTNMGIRHHVPEGRNIRGASRGGTAVCCPPPPPIQNLKYANLLAL